MRREVQKIVWLLLLPVIYAVLLLPGQVEADEILNIIIPVKIGKTSGAPAGTQYQVVLEAVTTNAPMPAQNVVTIKDGDTAEFGPLTYTVPGDYQYRIYEQDSKQNYFTYDAAIYDVTVRIVNDGQGGLVSEIGAKKEGDTGKSSIEFNNKYLVPKPSITATTVSTTVSTAVSTTVSTTVPTTKTTVVTKYQTVPRTIASNNNSTTTSNNPITKSNTVFSLKGPKTGDNSNPIFWFCILILSWFGIIGIITIRNRKKHSEV